MVAVAAATRFYWTYVAQMTLLRPSVGLSDFWAGSGFEDKLLQAQGDFSLNAGQHSVTYLPNDETTAMDCPSPPTRWKPRSTSTACTSTSCSAALGCVCAPWLRALAPGPPRVPHHFTSNSTRSSSGTLRSMSLRATWRSCVPSASLVVTWATVWRSTMPSSSPSVAEVSTATV